MKIGLTGGILQSIVYSGPLLFWPSIEKNDSGLKTREAYTHSVYMNCPHVRHTCMSKASTWYVS